MVVVKKMPIRFPHNFHLTHNLFSFTTALSSIILRTLYYSGQSYCTRKPVINATLKKHTKSVDTIWTLPYCCLSLNCFHRF